MFYSDLFKKVKDIFDKGYSYSNPLVFKLKQKMK